MPWFAVAVSGGFPGLASANLVFRPIPSLRFFAGPSWGYVSWGMQGGIVFAPWSSFFTPTVSVEAGKLFQFDLAFLAKDDGGAPSELKPLLRSIDYQYVAADLGFELGNPRGLAWFLRLGLSFVTVKANGAATYTNDDGTRVVFRDPTIRATLPSLRTGLQYWF